MSQSATSEESRRMITALEMSGNFRVLRRFEPVQKLLAFESMQAQAESKIAMVLNARSTGGAAAKVVELGYQLVRFHPKTGVIYEVEAEYSGFEDPGHALGGRFQAATGITDEDVAGTQFDDARIVEDIERSVVFVCHDAASQRAALERRFPALQDKWFTCAEREMDWRVYGASCKALEFLAFAVGGFFYSGSRALVEAQVLTDLLARKGPDGAQLLKVLMDRSRRPAWRVWAKDSPLEARDALEARGYKWNDGTDPVRPLMAWWKATEALDIELEFLATRIYGAAATVPIEKITGRERYSGRLGVVEDVAIGVQSGSSSAAGQGAASGPAPAPAQRQAAAPRASAAPAAGRSGDGNGAAHRGGTAPSDRQRQGAVPPQARQPQAAGWTGSEFPI